MAPNKLPSSESLDLRDKRILLIEDEYYIADDLRRALVACGASVSGPCSSLAAARDAVAHEQFDFAIVDLNLHGESAVPVADDLIEQGRSFAIATGYGVATIPDRLHSVPRVEKPFDPPEVLCLLRELGGPSEP